MLNPGNLEDTLEGLFSFDVLGRDMQKLRKDADNEELQNKLADVLKAAAVEKLGASDAADVAQIGEAAKARVMQYVAAAKAGKGKGCG